MANAVSNGYENLEVVPQFSVWITRSQGTRAALRPCRWSRAKTNAADIVWTLTMRPSTWCCPSLSSGLVEIICALGISVTMKHLIKKASSAMLNLTKSVARFWKLRRKCTRDFVFARIRPKMMTVSKMLRVMHENDLFDTFPEYSKVVHTLAVITVTLCSTERPLSPLRWLKTYFCSTMEQQRVSNIALINVTLKGHMPTL